MTKIQLLCDHLKEKLREKLPADESHNKLIPASRIKEMKKGIESLIFRDSAVLVLIFEMDDDIKTVLIKRPEYPGVHSGQISFPGGKKEKEDQNLIDTAIRESQEEIGLNINNIEILGTLSEILIPPSRFRVLPVVAFYKGKPEFVPDPEEVDSLIFPSMMELLPESSIVKEKVSIGMFGKIEVPAYKHKGHIIWGATAMMLSEFLDIIRKK